jgi:1-deoxy-D-xylulose-5-phosphate synthase
VEHEVLITIEEGSIGGFATQVMYFMALAGLLDNGLKFRPMCFPDFFIDHDTPAKQYELAGLTAADIVANALSALGQMIAETPARA